MSLLLFTPFKEQTFTKKNPFSERMVYKGAFIREYTVSHFFTTVLTSTFFTQHEFTQ